MTFVISVILFILLVLAISVAIHYRNESENLVVVYEAQREADVEAWNQGRDELEELYQGEILTIGENWDACQGALEAAYVIIEEHEINALNAKETILGMDRHHTRLMNNNRILTDAFEKVVNDHDLVTKESETWEELYAEAATELYETVTEIDKIAKEVHDWRAPQGSPFD